MLKIFNIIITSIFLFSSATAENIRIFEFTEKELSELEVRKVRGADNRTNYSVGSNENGNFLLAIKRSKLTLIKPPILILHGKLRRI